ncbi:hypothetical protein C1701_02670 [Actinoalloteichus sp. AHMU CJ021]|uniref:hypothetical protein n=1 Tax=Actinoalloteichus TaxID=65496 RepID=UPI0004AA463A|nr:hypothetical protein [Actinoalloteichus caeruleus]AUS77455.1 hypothetical protein C1701_02670 [Actinoalloteichus sp. AHMU CJ021]
MTTPGPLSRLRSGAAALAVLAATGVALTPATAAAQALPPYSSPDAAPVARAAEPTASPLLVWPAPLALALSADGRAETARAVGALLPRADQDADPTKPGLLVALAPGLPTLFLTPGSD